VFRLPDGTAVTRDPGTGGHADLSTTQRYMHLSPAATEDAIRLLDGRPTDAECSKKIGDILDTRSAKSGSD